MTPSTWILIGAWAALLPAAALILLRARQRRIAETGIAEALVKSMATLRDEIEAKRETLRGAATRWADDIRGEFIRAEAILAREQVAEAIEETGEDMDP